MKKRNIYFIFIICLSVHLFIDLSIYFNNSRTQGLIFRFLFSSLCACLHCKLACASIHKYVFLPVFMFPSLLVYSFDWYLFLLLYLLNVFTVVVRFDFITYSSFSSIISHHFFFSFFHPSVGGELKTLSSRDMVHPYLSVIWVSCLR